MIYYRITMGKLTFQVWNCRDVARRPRLSKHHHLHSTGIQMCSEISFSINVISIEFTFNHGGVCLFKHHHLHSTVIQMCSENSFSINVISIEFTFNHGGVCLFYKSFFKARDIGLSLYKSIEVISCYINDAMMNVLVVIYRPGSETMKNAFFDDFEGVLERISGFTSSSYFLWKMSTSTWMSKMNKIHLSSTHYFRAMISFNISLDKSSMKATLSAFSSHIPTPHQRPYSLKSYRCPITHSS